MTTEHVAARINAWEVAQRQFDLAAENADLRDGFAIVAGTPDREEIGACLQEKIEWFARGAGIILRAHGFENAVA